MQARVDLNDARTLVALQHLATLGPQGARSVMHRISRYMLSSMQRRFNAQEGPDGKSWEPSDRARSEGGQTLRDTGRLLRSLTWRYGADYAEAGTNVPYGAAHQFGVHKMINIRAHRRTRRKTSKTGRVSLSSWTVRSYPRLMLLPARPFAGFSRTDEERIVQLLREGIARLTAK